jgi:malonyl-CoA/methylmalonyl-CoA synthetase
MGFSGLRRVASLLASPVDDETMGVPANLQGVRPAGASMAGQISVLEDRPANLLFASREHSTPGKIMTNHLFDSFRDRMPAPDSLLMETDDGRSIAYGDMLARSGQYAGALVEAGARPGDRIAVQVEKSPEALLLYLACVRAGAVFLPLNTAYTLPELDYFFRDAEPRLVVCDPERATDIGALAASAGAATLTLGRDGRGTLADAAARQQTDFADVARGPDDLAAILYTSGTTGRSKGAMLSHENLASNARVLVGHWRFGPDDMLIHALPIFHTHGLFVATNVILMAGAAMFFERKFDPGRVISLLPRATALMGVPTFYVRLLQQDGLTPDAARGMRLFISGSAPLLAETHRAWRERTGHAILERYGMTETNMNTSNPYEGERRAGTVGFPLPGVSLRVTDPETAKPLAQGEIGMIEVKGPNVFAGYWRMPEKTKAEFRGDGFFITGDLGMIDADGYVHIVGRGKDLIISGGYNVYPKEIESEIDALDGVSESAVIGVAHPDFGEGVTAVVVRMPGSAIDAADIAGAIAGRLAKYKHPKQVIFVDELPRNTMGKVQKNVLREAYKDIYSKAG